MKLSRLPIDVALTYAGKQENYVSNVDKYLKSSGVVSWFLPFEKAKLWGEDLIPYLQRIYRDDATLCVMFISKEYVESAWPTFERTSALERQLIEDRAYILPVRFDDTPVPGLSNTIYYLKAGDYTEEDLAGIIVEKLKTIYSNE